ncbi:MAG: hypothetical protein WED04_12825 [Promethearchaeati archaeon SRVP18_Atabeyarchaeia-1]
MPAKSSDTDEKIREIDSRIKALEEKLNSGEISGEDYIPQLLQLFYEVEELSPKAGKSRKGKINLRATIGGGVVGWLVFLVALVLLGPLELSLRGGSVSLTGSGPYQILLNLLSSSDIQSIQSSQPFFVFLYYLIMSICTFPDIFTVAFPVLGGLTAGAVTRYIRRKSEGDSIIVGRKKFYYLRLDEGFVAGGVVAAVLTLIILLVSALFFGQWLIGRGIPVDESTLPLGYLIRVFLPTLFVYHLAAGGAAGALGEVLKSRKIRR